MKKVLIFLFLVFLCLPIKNAFATDRVEINTASLQQLDQITGIGPALAQKIIDARPFFSVDDLLKVKGIGEKTLQKIKDQGLAYVASQPQQPAQEVTPTPTPAAPPAPIPPPPPAPTPVATYPSGVFINEILPAPEGADETNEWIELYNTNNFDVDLQNWKIQDTEGTITTYVFLKDAKIKSGGYLVLKRPDTKIMLNNDQDGLTLMSPDGKTVDSVLYKNTPKNQSYNKTSADWQWSTTLTPGSLNIVAANIVKKEIIALPKSKKTDNKINIASLSMSGPINSIENSLSNNLEKTNKSSPWFLFLVALMVTIISTVIILILKFKLFRKSSPS